MKKISGHLIDAIAAIPDALLILNFASQSSNILGQAVSFGLKNRITIVLAWGSGLEQFEVLGTDICEGVYFGAQYWHGIDSPDNQAFVAATQKRFNINPNYSLEGGWMMVDLFVRAALEIDLKDTAKIAEKLRGKKYHDLTGEEKIRAADQQVLKNYYLLKGKAKSSMSDKDDYAEIVSTGKSYLDPEAADCKSS